jgi:hypothetical protein
LFPRRQGRKESQQGTFMYGATENFSGEFGSIDPNRRVTQCRRQFANRLHERCDDTFHSYAVDLDDDEALAATRVAMMIGC